MTRFIIFKKKKTGNLYKFDRTYLKQSLNHRNNTLTLDLFIYISNNNSE